jgi:putative membrane protein
MWWDWSFGGWWIMALMMLFMFLFWGGIIALIVWLVVRVSRRDAAPGRRSDPLEIARERYARGEISKEEFERRKKDLS